MKKTFKELTNADQIVGTMYQNNPDLKDTKFGYAWKRFYQKNMEPIYNKLKEDLADISIEFALEDEKTKELLKDDKGNFKYSREGQKNLLKAQRELLQKVESTEVEIEPHISTYVPELTAEESEALEGLVIKKGNEKS